MTLTDIRQRYPQYNQLSDSELASRLYNKYYADKLSRAEFAQRMGLNPNATTQNKDFTPAPYGTSQPGQLLSGIADIGRGFGNAFAIRPINFMNEETAKLINYLFHKNLLPKKLGKYPMELPHTDAAKYGGAAGNILGTGALAAFGGGATPELLALKGAGFVPALGRFATGVAGNSALGAAEDPNHRGVGAAVGALGGATGHTIAEIAPKLWPAVKAFFGHKAAQTERVLSRLGQQNAKGAILSPQEAEEHFTKNYRSSEGQPLPVDIGTVVHDPQLQTFRQSLPWTDVSSKTAAVEKAAINRELTAAQDARQALQDQVLPHIEKQLPVELNNLKQGLNTPGPLNQVVADHVRAAYKGIKKAGNELYAPLNNSTIQLSKAHLPTYQAHALELLNNRDHLQTVFGDDKDFSRSLATELTHAENLLSPKNETVTVSDAIQRSQQLGSLARAAKNRGRFNEARLLSNLKQGLDTDVENGLIQQGHQALADQLNKANAFWATQVVPYHGNTVLRKTVLYKHTPIKDELAKALLDPNQDALLNHLEVPTKNGLVYQLMTKGRGTSSGKANLTADKIGSTYAQLPGDYKTQIARFNPDIDALFERTPMALDKNKVLQKAISDWDKKIERLKAQKFGHHPSHYQTEIPPLPKHLGEWLTMPFNPLGRARLSAFTRLGVPVANRNWEEVLTSPELRERYFRSLPLKLGQPSVKPAKNAVLNRVWIPALGSPLYGAGGNQ